MSESVDPVRVTATPAAREAITALCAARGGPVMFVQSGGCCAGSTPMCYPDDEFVVGDVDLLLGDIDGCPFYIDKRLDQAWHHEQFILDVEPGEPEGFSLPAGPNQHFITRCPACVLPSASRWSDACGRRAPIDQQPPTPKGHNPPSPVQRHIKQVATRNYLSRLLRLLHIWPLGGPRSGGLVQIP